MLEIDDLHKRYGDTVALDGCTFTVQPGRMLGFLGRNGAGKTTTMRAIFGLVRPDAGAVRWKGAPLARADRLRFGYMPEERGLYPKMSAADQLTYFARLHGMDADAAADAAARWLEQVGLTDRAEDKVEALSQGNQQRVQLAVALIHDPDVAILDEPFNGLDPISVATMTRILRERAAAGTTVLFSSHQLDLVEDLCEDVAIINQGRIVLTGALDDLKSASPHRRVELDLDRDQAARLDGVVGVIDSRFDGRRHVLTVPRDTDLAALLQAVSGTRPPDHFVYTTPSLTDLFTEAVA